VPQLRDRTLDVALLRIVGSPSRYPFGEDLNVEVLFKNRMLNPVVQLFIKQVRSTMKSLASP